MKNLWIIANWKSNKSLSEALEWISIVGPKLETNPSLKVVVCPDFLSIEEVKKQTLVGNFPILVGSQDLSSFPEGAHTGEEAAKFLSQFVNLAILGHSERRQSDSETDDQVAEKVNQADKYGITPLVCIQAVDTPVPEACKLVAYEPIFAIGTGNPDTPANAESIAKSIKEKCGEALEVLYGGSINHDNATAFVKMEDISGLLIGKSSLDAGEFLNIIEAVKSIS